MFKVCEYYSLNNHKMTHHSYDKLSFALFFYHFVLLFVVTPVMSLVGCIKIFFKISNLYPMTNIIEDRIIIIYFRILTAATQFECNLLCVTDCLLDRHEWFCWCCCCLYFLFTTRYA